VEKQPGEEEEARMTWFVGLLLGTFGLLVILLHQLVS